MGQEALVTVDLTGRWWIIIAKIHTPCMESVHMHACKVATILGVKCLHWPCALALGRPLIHRCYRSLIVEALPLHRLPTLIRSRAYQRCDTTKLSDSHGSGLSQGVLWCSYFFGRGWHFESQLLAIYMAIYNNILSAFKIWIVSFYISCIFISMLDQWSTHLSCTRHPTAHFTYT